MFRNFNLDYAIAPNIFGVYSHFIQFRLLFGTQDKVDRNRDEDWPSKHWGSDTPTTGSHPSISGAQQSTEPGVTESAEQPAESVEPPVASVPASKKTYQDYLESADTYQSQNDYRNALREYGKAQKLLPPNDKRKVFTYEQQAQMALKLRDIPKAKEFYLAAIQTAKRLKVTDGSVVNSYLGIAYCFERGGNKSLAIKNYEKASSLTKSEATKERIRKNVQRLRGTR